MSAQNTFFQKIKIKAGSTSHWERSVEASAEDSCGSNLYSLFWSDDYTTHDFTEKLKAQ